MQVARDKIARALDKSYHRNLTWFFFLPLRNCRLNNSTLDRDPRLREQHLTTWIFTNFHYCPAIPRILSNLALRFQRSVRTYKKKQRDKLVGKSAKLQRDQSFNN